MPKKKFFNLFFYTAFIFLINSNLVFSQSGLMDLPVIDSSISPNDGSIIGANNLNAVAIIDTSASDAGISPAVDTSLNNFSTSNSVSNANVDKLLIFKKVYDSISRSEIMLGSISLEDLERNKYFKWVNPNLKSKIIEPLVDKSVDPNLRFLVFIGMWCDDSRLIIPEFIKYIQLKNIDENRVHFYGLDRNKLGIDEVPNIYQVTNVPTIIGIKDGNVIFKIVENGKTGNWQEEMLNNLF